jgi:hypothetical protein
LGSIPKLVRMPAALSDCRDGRTWCRIHQQKNWGELDQLMAAQRDKAGKFVKGHAPIPGAHRPKGSLNMVTKTLRQQIEDAFTAKGGIQAFVEHLIIEFPAVAAALLSKLLPPVEVEQALKAAGGTVVVNIQPIASGSFVVNGDKPSAGTVLALEHHPEEPAPIERVEILPPEPQPANKSPIEPEEGDGSGVFVVRSAKRRRAMSD